MYSPVFSCRGVFFVPEMDKKRVAAFCSNPFFIQYISYIEKYNQSDKPISLFRTLRYQVPYSIIIGAILIVLIIAWYLIGLPLGIGGVVTI